MKKKGLDIQTIFENTISIQETQINKIIENTELQNSEEIKMYEKDSPYKIINDNKCNKDCPVIDFLNKQCLLNNTFLPFFILGFY